jgi:hypothetical protein
MRGPALHRDEPNYAVYCFRHNAKLYEYIEKQHHPMTSASSLNVMPSYAASSSSAPAPGSSSTYAPYVSSQISSLPSTGILSSQTNLSTP